MLLKGKKPLLKDAFSELLFFWWPFSDMKHLTWKIELSEKALRQIISAQK
jgi:hypothetical protein